MAITHDQLHLQVISGTTSATPGTRTSHNHKLNYAPSKNRILPVSFATDDDNPNAAVVSVVKVSSTQVTVKSDAASVTFNLFIFPDSIEPERLADVT